MNQWFKYRSKSFPSERFDIKLRCQKCGKEKKATIQECIQRWPYCSNIPMAIVWMHSECELDAAVDYMISNECFWFELLLDDVCFQNFQAFVRNKNINGCPLNLICADMGCSNESQINTCENFKNCLQLQPEIDNQPYEIIFS